MILYHCCPRKILDKVLDQGLMPGKLPATFRFGIPKDKPEGVFLSTYPFLFMHYAGGRENLAGAQIEVDVDGLELHPDPIGDVASSRKGSCFYVKERIGPERFKRICVSTDDKPCEFKEFKF